MFGSAARGDGSTTSDIDVLVVRPVDVDGLDPEWSAQVDRFADDVTAWTGDPCAVIEYSSEEISELATGDGRLPRDRRTDGIALTEQRVALLRHARARGEPTRRPSRAPEEGSRVPDRGGGRPRPGTPQRCGIERGDQQHQLQGCDLHPADRSLGQDRQPLGRCR
ncbi:MAG: nucleotidyltransferase domain-containing protein [Actinobacteria bacterium]|nr:nucleotidyltransferase domain-containing protein [Actinomycetota bacterium]